MKKIIILYCLVLSEMIFAQATPTCPSCVTIQGSQNTKESLLYLKDEIKLKDLEQKLVLHLNNNFVLCQSKSYKVDSIVDFVNFLPFIDQNKAVKCDETKSKRNYSKCMIDKKTKKIIRKLLVIKNLRTYLENHYKIDALQSEHIELALQKIVL
jgi:hypothetical protein